MQRQAVLTLLTDANLKSLLYSLMASFCCIILNFEKKLIELRTFLKHGLTKIKKISIVDIQLGSKYASVNITLQSFT